MYSNIKLTMPKTESPRTKGVNNGDFEIFKGKGISALVREEIQNSLDVVDAENADYPTLVEFHLFEIDTKDIPCFSELDDVLRKNEKYWEQKTQDDKTKDFFNQAKGSYSNGKVKVLHIADHNKTGLSRMNIDGRIAPYNALLFDDSVSNKQSGSGGCFGLGKNASFAFSSTRTLIVSSINMEGDAFSLGTIKLPTYVDDNGNRFDGSGYICSSEYKTIEPFNYINLNPNYNRNNRQGMDKFIISYNGESNKEEFIKEVVISVFNNFFYALYQKKLIVNVCGHVINGENVFQLIEEYGGLEQELVNVTSYRQYETILNPDKVFRLSGFEDNDVTVCIRISSEGTKCAGIIGRTGMKITNKNRFQSSIGFDAVVHIEGRKANDYYKQFENPEHNSWSWELIKHHPSGLKYYNMLFADIKAFLEAKTAELYNSQINAEGLNEFLPFSYKDGKQDRQGKLHVSSTEILSNAVEHISPKKKEKIKRNKIETGQYVCDEESGVLYKLEDNTETYVSPSGEKEKLTKGREAEDIDIIEEFDGNEDAPTIKLTEAEITDINRFRFGKLVKVEDVSARVKMVKNKYVISLITNRDIENGYLELVYARESIKQKPLNIHLNSVAINGTNVEIHKSGNKVEICNFKANTPVSVEVEMDNDDKLALEVLIYGNSI